MDSLTKRLLLNSGMLNPGTLPALLSNTTRLVYPDETLKKPEIDLYNARRALKHLEDGLEQRLDKTEINKRTKTVQSAIESLGPRESRYFQTRYVHNSVVLQRATSQRRRADSGAATKAAETRSRESAERARKAEEDLDKERKRKAAEEKEHEKKQAESLAEEEKKAKTAAQKAALQKKHKEQQEKRKLLAEQAEKRRKVLLANVKAEAAAARRALEALERNQKKEEAVARKERLAEIAKQRAEKNEGDLKEQKKKIDQTKKDLSFAQELWRKELLKKKLEKEVEDAKKLAEENEKQNAIEKQIASDLALAQRLRDEDFAKARKAEEDLKNLSDKSKKSGDEYNWYNKGWQKDWIKVNVPGDGNCLFHAVCVAMEKKDKDCHLILRKKAMDYMQANLDTPWQDQRDVHNNARSTWRSVLTGTAPHNLVVGFTDTTAKDPDEYIKLMKMPGTWGTEFEIRAIRQVLSKPLNIVMEYPGGVISSPPQFDGNPDDLHIYHRTPGAHYQAYLHRTRLS